MANEREYDETLTLLKHHLGIATELVEELTASVRSPSTAPAPDASESSRNGTPTFPASKQDLPLIEEVLGRASVSISEAAIRVIAAVAQWSGVGEAIPERPRDGKPPTYVRFVKDRKTFAYVQVRRDDLRIDLPVRGEDVPELKGQPVRARDVKDDNPWKVSLYVKDLDGVQDAVDGIAFAYERTFDEEPVAAE